MNTKLKLFLNVILRVGILIISLFFLIVQFRAKFQSGLFLDELCDSLSQAGASTFMFLCLLLMPLNWGIEIFKWKILTASFSATTVKQCIKGVLSGITISMFLPNRIGDVAGKILWLNPEYRWKGFYANFYSSIAQISVTLLFSSLASIYFLLSYYNGVTSIPYYHVFYILLILLTIMSLLFYFRLDLLGKLIQKIPSKKLRKFTFQSSVIEQISFSVRAIVILLSLLRFILYSTQFYFAIRAFGCAVGYIDCMMLISLIYLAITIIPQFAISEIASRSAATIAITGLFISAGGIFSCAYETPLLLSASFLWLINLFVPAVAGLTMLPAFDSLKSIRS